MVKQSMVQK